MWGPYWGVLMSQPRHVDQIQGFGMLMCKCILMGGDVWESGFLLQMCVQVLCMLVSGSKSSKSCVLRVFEVRCVSCWGSVWSVEASSMNRSWRVNGMSESRMPGRQVRGMFACVGMYRCVFQGMRWICRRDVWV